MKERASIEFCWPSENYDRPALLRVNGAAEADDCLALAHDLAAACAQILAPHVDSGEPASHAECELLRHAMQTVAALAATVRNRTCVS